MNNLTAKKNMNNFLDSLAKPFLPVAPWLLRLGLGTSFILHGLGKFPLPPTRMVDWFAGMGYKNPEAVTSLVAIGEVAAGVGIIIGGLLYLLNLIFKEKEFFIAQDAVWHYFRHKFALRVYFFLFYNLKQFLFLLIRDAR